MDLHKIRLSSNCFTFSKIVNPVEVKPDIASKYEFNKDKFCMLNNKVLILLMETGNNQSIQLIFFHKE